MRARGLAVARRMRERIDARREDLAGAARVARDDGAAARHRFRDHQAERFGSRARVHHDVERADRLVGGFDEAGEADAAGEPVRVGVCTQFLDAVTGCPPCGTSAPPMT